MRSLFAGQKVWIWDGVDAETRAQISLALQDNGAPLQDGGWLQEEHSDAEFLVVDDVEKSEVQELKAKGGTIIGVECVNQSIEQRWPLPKVGRILCCRALEGFKVCITGFSKHEDERLHLTSKAVAMGAECTNLIDGSITTVVSRCGFNEKCKYGVKMNKPVVTPAWVERCWAKHAALPEKDFQVPVFAGLKICCTSLKNPEKEKVMQLTVENGGVFRADLDSTCTHLVCGSTKSKKFHVARTRMRLAVVTPEWVYKSVAAKGLLEESQFAPPEPEDEALPASLRSNSQTSWGQTARLASGTQGSLTLTRVVATPTEDEACFARADSGKHASTADRDTDANDMGDADKLFLASCRLYFAGMAGEELREAMRIMRASGATRYALLDERATHVVLGDAPDCDLSDVQRLESSGVVEVVRLSWLRACLQFRKLIPVSEKYRVPRDELAAPRVAKSKPSASGQPSKKQGLVTTLASSKLQKGPVAADDDDSPNEPGSSEWEKSRDSQRQASQRPGRECSRGGVGEGSGEAGNDPPVLEMQSDIFDDASRTGFGPSAVANVSTRGRDVSILDRDVTMSGRDVSMPGRDVNGPPLTLGKRFMSPKRASVSQREASASPKLAAAFSSEGAISGGRIKTVMGPPAGKWLAAARNPVKANPFGNRVEDVGAARSFDPGNEVNPRGDNPIDTEPSEGLSSGGLRTASKGVASFRSWGRLETPGQQTPGSSQPTPGTQVPEWSDVFEGLRFHVDVSMEADHQAHAMKLLKQGSGEVAESSTESVHYFVVSHGFDEAASNAEPPGAEAVTLFWIVQCLKEHRLIPLDDRPFYRPLPYAVPLPSFRSATISLTRYNGQVHDYYKDLAKALGAKVVNGFNKDVTYLVAKYAGGDKYRAMQRRGGPVATGEWLEACVQQGCLVSVDAFAPPPLPADVTDAPSQAAGIPVSQQEARSPGSAEDSAQRPTSMPPPRTKSTSRASQLSQPASQSQRKRPKKESPRPRPGDFENLDDLAATWTGSQAPSPPKSAKPQLDLRKGAKPEPVESDLGLRKCVEGGASVERPGGRSSGGKVAQANETGGSNRAPGSALAKPTGERNERPVENRDCGAERPKAVTSASGFADDGLRGGQKTPGESSKEHALPDETPSKNTRSRRGDSSEPKLAPPSRGKRKSDDREPENGVAADLQEGQNGARQKQRRSDGLGEAPGERVQEAGVAHVAEAGGGHVAGEGRKETGEKGREAEKDVGSARVIGELVGDVANRADGKEGAGRVDGPGGRKGEAGDQNRAANGAEGDEKWGDEKWAEMTSLIANLGPSNTSSARADEKPESGFEGSDLKRPRIAKAWPVQEAAVQVSDGPQTRHRTAMSAVGGMPAVCPRVKPADRSMTAVPDDYRFQESQMDSQMIGYDDGAAQNLVLFEQVRKSNRLNSSVKSAALPKAVRQKQNEGLRNLLETANRNT